MSTKTPSAYSGKSTALIIGGLVVAVLAFAAAKEFGIVEGAVAKRAVAMIFGVILIVTGNLLPKLVLPLSAQRRDPVRAKAAERIAGWILVLAGILYITVWFLTPPADAMLISSAIGLGAFVLASAAWARGALSRNQKK